MKIYLVRHGQSESNVIGRFNYIDEDINYNWKDTLKLVLFLWDLIKQILFLLLVLFAFFSNIWYNMLTI